MIGSASRPHVALVVGLFSIGLGLAEICCGEAVLGYGQSVSRREDLKAFRRAVALHFLCGIGAIAYFLYSTFIAD